MKIYYIEVEDTDSDNRPCYSPYDPDVFYATEQLALEKLEQLQATERENHLVAIEREREAYNRKKNEHNALYVARLRDQPWNGAYKPRTLHSRFLIEEAELIES